MRTVHETEALRPSDPIPKSMQPQVVKGGNRLKIVLKNQGTRASGESQSPGPGRAGDSATAAADSHEGLTVLTAEHGFTSDELALSSKELWRLARRQVHWAEEEAVGLKQEIEMMDELRNKEWLEKEILLDQVIKNEMDWFERRKHVLATLPTVEELRSQTMAKMDRADGKVKREDGKVKREDGKVKREERETEKREQREDQREAAAALASLAQQS